MTLPHERITLVITNPYNKLAFEFLVLAAARSGEVRLARWNEIDLDADVWTVPAERMKANREHRVPLSCRAAEILQAARPRRNGSTLVFPSPQARRSSELCGVGSAAGVDPGVCLERYSA